MVRTTWYGRMPAAMKAAARAARGSGELVAVTPRDAWALCRPLGLSFDTLMTTHLTLP